MKSVVLLLTVAVVVAVASSASHPSVTEEEYQALFGQYVQEWNKTYVDAAHTFNAFNAFKSNFELVYKHNAEAAAGKHSFTLGMNQFADMTNEEYKRKVLGLKRKQGTTKHQLPKYTPAHSTISDDSQIIKSLPASFDWRTLNAVNDVKDQGGCGSCWAFSATAAMEFAFWNKTKGTLLSLSEQLCVDCVNGGADNCENGGEMHDCYLEIMKLGGDETEGSYPYTGSDGTGCGYDKSKNVPLGITGYRNITQGDENALLVGASQAVVSIAIDASSPFFQLYFGGVYDNPSCANNWDGLDHGVAIVGWGHDAASNKDYWLVRNSWGGFWGLSGYIWMRRNANNQCGVATDATIPLYK